MISSVKLGRAYHPLLPRAARGRLLHAACKSAQRRAAIDSSSRYSPFPKWDRCSDCLVEAFRGFRFPRRCSREQFGAVSPRSVSACRSRRVEDPDVVGTLMSANRGRQAASRRGVAIAYGLGRFVCGSALCYTFRTNRNLVVLLPESA